ncbi:MAG: 30S ribosomal protein S17 [Candidatus Omnitrophica bacterium]|nr:30S ribosomal protein S17 [Candidatus Omnitrophota bacterium]
MESSHQLGQETKGSPSSHRYRKERVGVVVSNKMQKTVVVLVRRLTKHPQYKKVVGVNKKYKAHDEKGISKLGDKVLIREGRPISKTKRWTVIQVLQS